MRFMSGSLPLDILHLCASSPFQNAIIWIETFKTVNTRPKNEFSPLTKNKYSYIHRIYIKFCRQFIRCGRTSYEYETFKYEWNWLSFAWMHSVWLTKPSYIRLFRWKMASIRMNLIWLYFSVKRGKCRVLKIASREEKKKDIRMMEFSWVMFLYLMCTLLLAMMGHLP